MAEISLKDQAEILAECLELGIVAVAEVIAWADGHIETEDEPDPAVIEVALAVGERVNDVVNLLRSVSGEANRQRVTSAIFARMRIFFREHPDSLETVRRGLYLMSSDAPNESAAAFMEQLLERSGATGSDAQTLRSDIEAFLERAM